MFDQQAMWEMNKAHHEELLTAAQARRLSAQGHRSPMRLLKSLLVLLARERPATAQEVWREPQVAHRAMPR